MAADRQSPEAIRGWLVRLGHLSFDDFLLLAPPVLASFFIVHPSSLPDWSLALNNAPHILLHFRRSVNLQSAIFNLQSPASAADISAAQQRLVTHFAYELLRAKAPPLYDALPWHDWDFSIVARRFPLWKTRFLLAGDGTTVTMCRCRKSAGVYAVEPDKAIARYVERKAEVEKVRRFRGVNSSLTASLPLPPASADLAIVGSIPSLNTDNWKLAIHELLRVSANVLLLENNPLAPPLDDKLLTASGFQPASIEARSLGQRRCWWYIQDTRSPA